MLFIGPSSNVERQKNKSGKKSKGQKLTTV